MAIQKKTAIAAFVIASIMMVAGVLALLSSTKTIPTSGTINSFNVGVYQSDLVTPITSITFSAIIPGGTTTATIYVKNNAAATDMMLNMTVGAWSSTPTNSTNVVSMSWDREGYTLTHGSSVQATITLTAADNAETRAGLTFTGVNINIVGTQI